MIKIKIHHLRQTMERLQLILKSPVFRKGKEIGIREENLRIMSPTVVYQVQLAQPPGLGAKTTLQ